MDDRIQSQGTIVRAGAATSGQIGVGVTHQTVDLARGKHASPSDGVCVTELSSMLAGEPFTDRPASVSPVGGLLARLSGPWSLPSSLAAVERLADRVARDMQRYAGGGHALALADELIAMGVSPPPEMPAAGARGRAPALAAAG